MFAVLDFVSELLYSCCRLTSIHCLLFLGLQYQCYQFKHILCCQRQATTTGIHIVRGSEWAKQTEQRQRQGRVLNTVSLCWLGTGTQPPPPRQRNSIEQSDSDSGWGCAHDRDIVVHHCWTVRHSGGKGHTDTTRSGRFVWEIASLVICLLEHN